MTWACEDNSATNLLVDTRWPDPFCDVASRVMPTSPTHMLNLAQSLVLNNAIYSQALQKIVSYFLADIEVFPLGDEAMAESDKQQRENFFRNDMQIMSELWSIGYDYLTYGNVFACVVQPPSWHVACRTPNCGFEAPYLKVRRESVFQAKAADYSLYAKCPRCRSQHVWRMVERKNPDRSAVSLLRIPPQQVDIDWDRTTSRGQYFWRLDETIRSRVRRGDEIVMSTIQPDILECVKREAYLRFEPDAIYHLREPYLAGLLWDGWGMPRPLAHFKLAWYVQILMKLNEGIAIDYTAPTRVLSPEIRSGASGGGEMSDPMLEIGMAQVRTYLEDMLQRSRIDPFRWNISPIPLRAQILGGDAKQLAPVELINAGNADLLAAIGIPENLFRLQLESQSSPPTLRLMESHFAPYVAAINGFLSYVANRVAKLRNWAPFGLRLVKVSHADDLNNQMAKLQLMQTGDISRTDGLRSINVDYAEQVKQKVEDARLEAEAQQAMQEKLEAASAIDAAAPTPEQVMQQQQQQMAMQGAGGAAAGPAPAGGMGGAPAAPEAFAAQQGMTTPLPPSGELDLEELRAQADTIAQQLLSSPESVKDSKLIALKKTNEVLHYFVRERLAQLRKEMSQQAQMAVAAPM